MERPVFEHTLVDGHVHFHRCFDPVRFLAGARAHFRRAAKSLGLPATTPGVLLLTESEGEDGFSLLREVPAALRDGGWTVDETGEPVSLRACHPGDGDIMLVAGRQIACRERIEVLALGRTAPYPDGAPVERVLRDITEGGDPAVLPWGFGKWWGGRGRIMEGLLERADPRTTFLADSGVRLRGTRRPRLLREAENRGFRILAGSDPLPFRGQEGVAGRYGFLLRRPLAPEAPMASIRKALFEEQEFMIWGRLAGWAEFVRSQTAMQLRRRRGGETG
ncbi:MAG: hypothetical protein ABIK65_04475 [Candidatus Eisenbacteria bacterium]